MSDYKIVMAPDINSAKEYVETHNVVATVEAEYGDTCIEGKELTLAHHGSRSNNPAPCNDDRAHKLNGGEILISHIDLDTVGGILAIMGQKFENPDFWAAAEYIDVNGVHHSHELSEDIQNMLNAYYAWGETHRGNRITEITDVTEQILSQKEILDIVLDQNHPEHDEAIQKGKEWHDRITQAVESKLVDENENVRVFKTDGTFCSASYYSPNQKTIVPATVSFNTKFNAITVAFEDGGTNLSAKDIVQRLWGKDAGGRDGIAGSPRNWEKSTEELQYEFQRASCFVKELVSLRKTSKDLSSEELYAVAEKKTNERLSEGTGNLKECSFELIESATKLGDVISRNPKAPSNHPKR